MSVTRLRASNEEFYFINNDTFDVKVDKLTCMKEYDYANLTGSDFMIGSTLLYYCINDNNDGFVSMCLNTSDGRSFSLFQHYSDNKSFIKRPILYFKPVDGIIKIPDKGYHAVVVSESEFKQSETESVVVFAILVFNSEGMLIGVVNPCCLLSRDFNLSYCNDAKFATLGRFADKETMRKEIFR